MIIVCLINALSRTALYQVNYADVYTKGGN
jgi:hypothetical protein